MELSLRSVRELSVILALIVIAGAVSTQAQGVRASQKATVSQKVANTTISIEYSRPSAKGRKLFGPKGIIKFDKIWMPGANEASNINFSSDVVLNGKPLAAGRYSIWVIPTERSWTIILSKDWEQWHTRYPGKKDDALRISVSPKEAAHSEFLSFYFPVVTASSTVFNFHWGKTVIPFEVKLAGK